MASEFSLTDFEKSALLDLARSVLKDLAVEDPDFHTFERDILTEHPILEERHPCFVTLLTQRGTLRGCIGNTKSYTPLYKNVATYARLAALEDPRFPPVKAEEAASLKVEISVLGPLHPLALKDLDSIKIGTHGLVVQEGQRRGLLLAKVASEYGWTPKQFLSHTCEKAGLTFERVADYQLSYFKELSF